MRDETKAIHEGFSSDPTTNSVAVPIYQTVAYTFDDAKHGADLFNLEVAGNIYSRLMNPTTDVLEKRMASLEGGLAGLCVSSGQSAITYALQTITKSGDHIVTAPNLYGGTYTLFSCMLKDQGIEVTFADSNSPEDIEKAMKPNTKAVYCESIGNPSGKIADLEAYAKIAHKHGVPLIVDNTVATPVLCKPIEFGADIVVHSLTKYVGGHGTTLGGVIIDSGKFDWNKNPDKFPMLTKPEPAYHNIIYTEAFGEAAFIARTRTVPLRNTGSALAAQSAFNLIQGLETLSLRMERHTENALSVAKYLENHSNVNWVNYAGLDSSPQKELANKYSKGKPSGILTFGVNGGLEAGIKFYNKLELFKRLVNIGDAKSLACHPASTTHRQLNDDELVLAGISPDMIRLSVGIEHIDDLIADLEQALS